MNCTNCGQYLAEQCMDCELGPMIPKWVVSDSLYKIYKHKLANGEDVSDRPKEVRQWI